MSTIESIEAGILPAELREALRTLLGQSTEPYLDLPDTSDGPGICIGPSFADLRRYIETKHREKLDLQPRVPANYHARSTRRRLPSSPLSPTKRDMATQTEPSWNPRPRTPQTESAPETGSPTRKRSRRPLPSRVVCSSSSDRDFDRGRPRQSPSQSSPAHSQG
jgi:hypothetical protein